mmetsp:Transcript_6378/g.13298  ORF Transcript_6378/g.13298 Transcript_6378/m.13298 type:complete len:200 (+) Transcript_6378:144-743(+)
MSPSPIALTTFKVTIGRGGTSFLWFEFVRVHGQTHGTSRFPPIKAGGRQDLIQSFFFGLFLDETGPGDHHGVDAVGDFASHGNGGHFSNIFNATIGTRSNKDFFNGYSQQGLSLFQTNVFQGTGHGGLTGRVIAFQQGDIAGNGSHILGTGTPGNGGSNVLCINNDRLVIFGIFIRHQRFPIGDGLLPFFLRRRHGTTL